MEPANTQGLDQSFREVWFLLPKGFLISNRDENVDKKICLIFS